jgi:hypothetical protein
LLLRLAARGEKSLTRLARRVVGVEALASAPREAAQWMRGVAQWQRAGRAADPSSVQQSDLMTFFKFVFFPVRTCFRAVRISTEVLFLFRRSRRKQLTVIFHLTKENKQK